MATKTELALAISELLGEEINPDDHTHDELSDMLSDARDGDGGDEASTEQLFTVCEGRAVTSKRGILEHGDIVAPKDFAADFDQLIDAGMVVKYDKPA